jgi:hypothetical protein
MNRRGIVPTLATVALAASALSACRQAAPDGASALVRDSAGIRLVDHPAELGQGIIELELLWEHGHGPDDYAFQFVSVGALAPDGSAIVSDAGNREVVVIDAEDGGHRLLAPPGQGPHEIQVPRAILVAGRDSVWVDDPGNGRLALFVGGESVTTIDLRGTTPLSFMEMPAGLDEDGGLLLQTGSYRSDFDVPWLDGYLMRYTPGAARLDTVGAYPMARRRPESGINPFAGYGVVSVAGHAFVHARSDLPELIWRSADGDTMQIVRWSPTLAHPDRAMWDEFVATMREDLVRVNPQMSREQAEAFAEQQVARYALDTSAPLPLFGHIVQGSSTGDVWLPDFFMSPAGTATHTVVSADGLSTAVATFPGPVRVLDVTEDRVLVLVHDELDVQGVAVYRYGAEW